MEISNNLIDLQYLTNPSFTHVIDKKINIHKNIKENITDVKTIQLHRRRIFLLTKHFLLGNKSRDVNLDDLFLKYCDSCIKYFKFEDNVNIIQRDYIEYNKKNNIIPANISKLDIKKNDNILFRENKKDDKLSKFVIKKTTKKSNIIPRIKKLN
jgi:hypothetical protein